MSEEQLEQVRQLLRKELRVEVSESGGRLWVNLRLGSETLCDDYAVIDDGTRN